MVPKELSCGEMRQYGRSRIQESPSHPSSSSDNSSQVVADNSSQVVADNSSQVATDNPPLTQAMLMEMERFLRRKVKLQWEIRRWCRR